MVFTGFGGSLCAVMHFRRGHGSSLVAAASLQELGVYAGQYVQLTAVLCCEQVDGMSGRLVMHHQHQHGRGYGREPAAAASMQLHGAQLAVHKCADEDLRALGA
jgi:hypothetical protein